MLSTFSFMQHYQTDQVITGSFRNEVDIATIMVHNTEVDNATFILGDKDDQNRFLFFTKTKTETDLSVVLLGGNFNGKMRKIRYMFRRSP